MPDGFFPPADADYLSGFELDPMVYDDFFEDVDWFGALCSRDLVWICNWTEFIDDWSSESKTLRKGAMIAPFLWLPILRGNRLACILHQGGPVIDNFLYQT